MDNAEKLRNLHDRLLATGADYSDVLLDSALEIERLRKKLFHVEEDLKAEERGQDNLRRCLDAVTAERDAAVKDAELGRIALGFVDRAGDTDADIDSAETICREFYLAMAAAIDAAKEKK